MLLPSAVEALRERHQLREREYGRNKDNLKELRVLQKKKESEKQSNAQLKQDWRSFHFLPASSPL